MGIILIIVGILSAGAIGFLVYCFCCQRKDDTENNDADDGYKNADKLQDVKKVDEE